MTTRTDGFDPDPRHDWPVGGFLRYVLIREARASAELDRDETVVVSETQR